MKQTELGMINAVLGAIEQSPIDVINLAHPDVKLAQDNWAEQSVELQATGWWFNQEVYELSIDARDNSIYLPAGTLAIDDTRGKLLKRGRRLYDKENHSFDMSSYSADERTITCIMEWSLEDLPPVAYRHILLLTKIVAVSIRTGNKDMLGTLGQELKNSFAVLQKQHLRYGSTNKQTVNNAALLLRSYPRRLY